MTPIQRYSLPFNKQRTEDFIESLIFDELFNQPQRTNSKAELSSFFHQLLLKIVPKEKAISIHQSFFNSLSATKQEMEQLIYIFYANDPASKSEIEIILSYPGFLAIAIHRLASTLFHQDTPILPRFFSEYAHSKTGIDIHPGATIGKNFYIDHGTGIVIGETTHIGDHVKIYQGVTLGAFYVAKNLADKKRHPTIKDNVTIYAGATILGGTTVIGENSIIGGNVWITESIEANSSVYQESKPIIKTKRNQEETNYII